MLNSTTRSNATSDFNSLTGPIVAEKNAWRSLTEFRETLESYCSEPALVRDPKRFVARVLDIARKSAKEWISPEIINHTFQCKLSRDQLGFSHKYFRDIAIPLHIMTAVRPWEPLVATEVDSKDFIARSRAAKRINQGRRPEMENLVIHDGIHSACQFAKGRFPVISAVGGYDGEIEGEIRALQSSGMPRYLARQVTSRAFEDELEVGFWASTNIPNIPPKLVGPISSFWLCCSGKTRWQIDASLQLKPLNDSAAAFLKGSWRRARRLDRLSSVSLDPKDLDSTLDLYIYVVLWYSVGSALRQFNSARTTKSKFDSIVSHILGEKYERKVKAVALRSFWEHFDRGSSPLIRKMAERISAARRENPTSDVLYKLFEERTRTRLPLG